MPTISVVIPVRDDAAPLEACLRALRGQRLAPYEIVVVDNASSDASADVARRYGARVVAEPRVGIPAAAATGYDAARGELIARCDADSRPPPDWLERIAAAFADDPTLDAVTGSGTFYDLPRWCARPLSVLYLGSFYVATHLALGHPPLWGSNMAVRSSAWRAVASAVHREDPELHDDIDLAFVLGPRRRLRYDRTLRVGVSGRSLDPAGLPRRFWRAGRTLAVNWPACPPWVRWARRWGIGS
ncbi:glycosyltransferase family 2 protein [Georgenia faecalis]|uniref:glycosyltransferase family 2 protein n=1 Tax=Georgenia faecalis TaxID=2483799 RepID=UPI000FD8ECCF|nr:glycosyltransferase family 2 protein [Georgenia faecalis]